MLTDLYVVPAARSATVSSITICNQSSMDATFRVSIAVTGAADEAKQYVYYDEVVRANKTFIATVGITLAALTVVRVYTSGSNVSFNIFGVEVS